MAGRHRTSGAAEISRYVLIAAPLTLVFLVVVGVALNLNAASPPAAPSVPQPPGLTAQGGALPPESGAPVPPDAQPPTTAVPPAPAPALPAVVEFSLPAGKGCRVQNGQLPNGVKVAACFVDDNRFYVVLSSDPTAMPAADVGTACRVKNPGCI